MAPEVVKQTAYTSKADIWSLGCLVVEMLTGAHPWANLTQMQAIFRVSLDFPLLRLARAQYTQLSFDQLFLRLDLVDDLQFPTIFRPTRMISSNKPSRLNTLLGRQLVSSSRTLSFVKMLAYKHRRGLPSVKGPDPHSSPFRFKKYCIFLYLLSLASFFFSLGPCLSLVVIFYFDACIKPLIGIFSVNLLSRLRCFARSEALRSS
jgi:serine/threonine protein kinase